MVVLWLFIQIGLRCLCAWLLVSESKEDSQFHLVLLGISFLNVVCVLSETSF